MKPVYPLLACLAMGLAPAAVHAAAPVAASQQQAEPTGTVFGAPLVNHLNMAYLAMLHNLPQESAASLQSALDVVTRLDPKQGAVSTGIIPVARLQFSFGNQRYECRFPYQLEEPLSRLIHPNRLRAGLVKMSLSDVEMLQATIHLDPKTLRPLLEDTQKSLLAQNRDAAFASLTNAINSQKLEVQKESSAFAQARQQLVLAKSLATDQFYDGSSMAIARAYNLLQNTPDRLNEVQAGKMRILLKDLTIIRNIIDKGKASQLQNLATTIQGCLKHLDALKL